MYVDQIIDIDGLGRNFVVFNEEGADREFKIDFTNMPRNKSEACGPIGYQATIVEAEISGNLIQNNGDSLIVKPLESGTKEPYFTATINWVVHNDYHYEVLETTIFEARDCIGFLKA